MNLRASSRLRCPRPRTRAPGPRRLPLLVAAAVAAAAFACGGSQRYTDHDPYGWYAVDDDDGVTRETADMRSDPRGEMLAMEVARGRRSPSPATVTAGSATLAGDVSTAAPPAPAGSAGLDPDAERLVATNSEVPNLEVDAPRRLPLLIYDGWLTLAIYDVEALQVRALSIVESRGGYAAERSADYLVLRVPAEDFRDTLDALAELGDVLQLGWDAQDVTERFNDVEMRLRNARNMRDHLEELLLRAENVSDALAIERELERITLEIERLEGTRRALVDRIAFATITLRFSPLAATDVPDDPYRLPFRWLNTLGVERLLQL